MAKFDAKCPCCGTINRNLFLEETHGLMECDHCHMSVNVFEFNSKSTIIVENKLFILDNSVLSFGTGAVAV